MVPHTTTGKLLVIVYALPGMLLMMSYLNLFSECILMIIRKVLSYFPANFYHFPANFLFYHYQVCLFLKPNLSKILKLIERLVNSLTKTSGEENKRLSSFTVSLILAGITLKIFSKTVQLQVQAE